jgi:anthranilate phosphoribosyltransferase
MDAFDKSLLKLLEAEDLSFEEASAAMDEIMTGKVPPIRLAAWLTAIKIKGEKAAEIGGCASSMLRSAIKINPLDADAIDTCGTGGDSSGTFNISTAAAFVAAGAGVTVAKHGNRAVSGKAGSADVLEKLRVNISLDPAEAEKCLNSIGIVFLFAPNFHPAMRYAAQVRKELGFRTIFNILGPLCSPASVKRALIGVYDERLCRLMAESALQLGYKKILVVHGNDGLDEISICSTTTVCEIRSGGIIEYEFNPQHHGFELCARDAISGGGAEENAEIIRGILSGKIDGPRRDVTILNAAAAILASGKSENWNTAILMAKEAIVSGKALSKLDALADFSFRKSLS